MNRDHARRELQGLFGPGAKISLNRKLWFADTKTAEITDLDNRIYVGAGESWREVVDDVKAQIQARHEPETEQGVPFD